MDLDGGTTTGTHGRSRLLRACSVGMRLRTAFAGRPFRGTSRRLLDPSVQTLFAAESVAGRYRASSRRTATMLAACWTASKMRGELPAVSDMKISSSSRLTLSRRLFKPSIEPSTSPIKCTDRQSTFLPRIHRLNSCRAYCWEMRTLSRERVRPSFQISSNDLNQPRSGAQSELEHSIARDPWN